jgi:hypothetical protein
MRPGQVAAYRQGVLPAAARAPAGAGGLTAEIQPEASSTRLALATLRGFRPCAGRMSARGSLRNES